MSALDKWQLDEPTNFRGGASVARTLPARIMLEQIERRLHEIIIQQVVFYVLSRLRTQGSDPTIGGSCGTVWAARHARRLTYYHPNVHTPVRDAPPALPLEESPLVKVVRGFEREGVPAA